MVSSQAASLLSVGLGDPFAPFRGFFKQTLLAAGGAGVNTLTLYSVPGDEIARINTVRFSLVTDANVANRNPVLQIQDADGNILAESGTNVNVTASLTWQISAFHEAGFGGLIGTSRLLIPLPDLFLLPGYKLVLANLNGQAGDVLGPTRLTIVHYENGGLGYELGTRIGSEESGV